MLDVATCKCVQRDSLAIAKPKVMTAIRINLSLVTSVFMGVTHRLLPPPVPLARAAWRDTVTNFTHRSSATWAIDSASARYSGLATLTPNLSCPSRHVITSCLYISISFIPSPAFPPASTSAAGRLARVEATAWYPACGPVDRAHRSCCCSGSWLEPLWFPCIRDDSWFMPFWIKYPSRVLVHLALSARHVGVRISKEIVIGDTDAREPRRSYDGL